MQRSASLAFDQHSFNLSHDKINTSIHSWAAVGCSFKGVTSVAAEPLFPPSPLLLFSSSPRLPLLLCAPLSPPSARTPDVSLLGGGHYQIKLFSGRPNPYTLPRPILARPPHPIPWKFMHRTIFSSNPAAVAHRSSSTKSASCTRLRRSDDL